MIQLQQQKNDNDFATKYYSITKNNSFTLKAI